MLWINHWFPQCYSACRLKPHTRKLPPDTHIVVTDLTGFRGQLCYEWGGALICKMNQILSYDGDTFFCTKPKRSALNKACNSLFLLLSLSSVVIGHTTNCIVVNLVRVPCDRMTDYARQCGHGYAVKQNAQELKNVKSLACHISTQKSKQRPR